MFHNSPHQFLIRLISLVALILICPIVDALGFGSWIFEIFSSVILLSAVYAVSESVNKEKIFAALSAYLLIGFV